MEENKKKFSRRQKVARHLGKVFLAATSVVFLTLPVQASEFVKSGEVLGNEGGKEVLSQALRIAKGKPALSVAAVITCLACAPVAGVAASPAMCVACGILITKVIG